MPSHSTSELFNATYMYQMVKSMTLCGEWLNLNTLKNEQAYYMPLKQNQGVMIVNTSNVFGLNLVMVDSKFIDQNYVVVPLDITIPFDELPPENITYKVTNQLVTYYKGDNFFNGRVRNSATCQTEDISIQIFFVNQTQNVPKHRNILDSLRMEVEIKAPDCFFNIKSSVLTPCNEEKADQIWIYLFLNLLRMTDNLMTSMIQYYEQEYNYIMKVQFLSILCIDSYFFFFNLKFAQFIKSAFILCVPMTLFSLGLDCSVFLKDLSRWTGVLTIFCSVIAVNVLLSFSAELYWLCLPYLIIPMTEIYNCFVQKIRRKYEYLLYIGHLLPAWFMMAYLKFYPYNFTKLEPEPQFTYASGFLFFFGLWVKKLKGKIQQNHARKERGKYVLDATEAALDSECSICMEQLTQENQALLAGSVPLENSQEIVPYHEVNVDELCEKKAKGKIVKTPCGHNFHLLCLRMWFKAKEVCPYCRKELNEIAPLLDED